MKRMSTKNTVRSTGAKGRVIARLMIGAVAILGLASAAMADAPFNDEQSGATIIEAIPYNNELITNEATAVPEESFCFPEGHTVWYSFTPSEATFIGANTFGSDYDTTLTAFEVGSEGLVIIACNDQSMGTNQSRVRFNAQPGVTYLFMVGAWLDTPAGILQFNLLVAPPLAQIELMIDSRGSVSPRTGLATLSGTVSCTSQVEVTLNGSLRQRASRFYINGYFWDSILCDGTTPWSVVVSSYDGWFAGGRADASVNAAAYEDDSYDYKTATVRLAGSRR